MAPIAPVNIDGLGVRAPNSEALLDHLLDFGKVRLQGLMAEHFGKHLKRQRRHKDFTLLITNYYTKTFVTKPMHIEGDLKQQTGCSSLPPLLTASTNMHTNKT